MVKPKTDRETDKLRKRLSKLFQNSTEAKTGKLSNNTSNQNISPQVKNTTQNFVSKSNTNQQQHVFPTNAQNKPANSIKQNIKPIINVKNNIQQKLQTHRVEHSSKEQLSNKKGNSQTAKSAAVNGFTKVKKKNPDANNGCKGAEKKHEKNKTTVYPKQNKKHVKDQSNSKPLSDKASKPLIRNNQKKTAVNPSASQQINGSSSTKYSHKRQAQPTATSSQPKKAKVKQEHLPNGHANKEDSTLSDGDSIDSIEYLEDALSGYVAGGDFDNNDVEEYDESYEFESDEEEEEEVDNDYHSCTDSETVPTISQPIKAKFEQEHLQNGHTNEEVSDVSDGDSVDSIKYLEKAFPGYIGEGDYDSNDDEDYDSYEFESEEEEEEDNEYHSYSDSDYTVEYDTEDYDSNTASETESASDESGCMYFDRSSSKDEYVPEDLIIHAGTAMKYALPAEDKVLLNSDAEDAHIVEPEQPTMKSIEQPLGYSIESLQILNENHTNMVVDYKALSFSREIDRHETESNSSTSTACPNLVPITQADIESEIDSFDEENYERISDDEASIVSIDINDKYLRPYDEYSSEDMYEDEGEEDEFYAEDRPPRPRNLFKVDLIKAPRQRELTPDVLKQVQQAGHDLEKGNLNKEIGVKEYRAPVQYSVKSVPVFDVCEELHATLAPSEDVPDPAPLAEHVYSTAESSPSQSSKMFSSFVKASTTKADRNIYCNAINSNDVLLLLKDDIYIYGTVRMTLVHGVVDVYGLLPEIGNCFEIYSPRGYSLVQIMPRKGAVDSIESVLSSFSATFTAKSLTQIHANYTPGQDALLLLQRNIRSKKMVSNFKKFMSENVFPNMQSLPHDHPHYASEYLLQCMINNETTKSLQIPYQWYGLHLETSTRMLLAGGKGVGKSTLLRFLINRHIRQHQRILVIDLDIGQPELFVPQTVSCSVVTTPLLGPGFFLTQQADRAYMVGHVNIGFCADLYLRAVKKLLEYCHENAEYANIPWLINTMGYNKGFGLELLACVTAYLKPSDVVQLQSNKKINNFEFALETAQLSTVPRIIYAADEFRPTENFTPTWILHKFYSGVPQQNRYQKEWDMSPKDMRYAMTIARLSTALQGNSEWLTDCQPVSAPLEKLHLLNILNSDDTREEILAAIEANLVYLCKFEADGEPLQCFGIGVVRGIDRHIDQVYLLPATHYKYLTAVNCLALGELTLPNSLFTNQGPKVRGLAPFVYNAVDANASKAIKQIYHRPAEFLTGVQREV